MIVLINYIVRYSTRFSRCKNFVIFVIKSNHEKITLNMSSIERFIVLFWEVLVSFIGRCYCPLLGGSLRIQYVLCCPLPHSSNHTHTLVPPYTQGATFPRSKTEQPHPCPTERTCRCLETLSLIRLRSYVVRLGVASVIPMFISMAMSVIR